MRGIEVREQGAVRDVRLLGRALNLEIVRELRAQLLTFTQDERVRIVVLRGNDKLFCAGADLHWMRDATTPELTEFAALFAELDHLPQAVIAVVEGPAIGGGVGLVACCDYVIASEAAWFQFSEVKLGLMPAMIAPYLLAKIGPAATRAYGTSAQRFNAQRAYELGIVQHVVATNTDTTQALDDIIAKYLEVAPGAIHATKTLLDELIHLPAVDATTRQQKTIAAIAARRASQEAQQGVAAFLEHAKAPWQA